MRNALTSVALISFVLLADSRPATAQNVGNPTILDAVNSVQSSLNQLQSSVSLIDSSVQGIDALKTALAALQGSVDALGQGSQVNTRFTPPVDVAAVGDLASCTAINVSSQPKSIQVQIFNSFGTVAENFPASVVPPGRIVGGGNRGGDFYYCKFTVVDGTKADIRGGMTVCTNTTCKQTVIAE